MNPNLILKLKFEYLCRNAHTGVLYSIMQTWLWGCRAVKRFKRAHPAVERFLHRKDPPTPDRECLVQTPESFRPAPKTSIEPHATDFAVTESVKREMKMIREIVTNQPKDTDFKQLPESFIALSILHIAINVAMKKSQANRPRNLSATRDKCSVALRSLNSDLDLSESTAMLWLPHLTAKPTDAVVFFLCFLQVCATNAKLLHKLTEKICEKEDETQIDFDVFKTTATANNYNYHHNHHVIDANVLSCVVEESCKMSTTYPLFRTNLAVFVVAAAASRTDTIAKIKTWANDAPLTTKHELVFITQRAALLLQRINQRDHSTGTPKSKTQSPGLGTPQKVGRSKTLANSPFSGQIPMLFDFYKILGTTGTPDTPDTPVEPKTRIGKMTAKLKATLTKSTKTPQLNYPVLTEEQSLTCKAIQLRRNLKIDYVPFLGVLVPTQSEDEELQFLKAVCSPSKKTVKLPSNIDCLLGLLFEHSKLLRFDTAEAFSCPAIKCVELFKEHRNILKLNYAVCLEILAFSGGVCSHVWETSDRERETQIAARTLKIAGPSVQSTFWDQLKTWLSLENNPSPSVIKTTLLRILEIFQSITPGTPGFATPSPR